MGRPSGDSDDLGAEVHDFQLQRQIQELRDERDRTRKAALDGANKPAVVDDDLRWLLCPHGVSPWIKELHGLKPLAKRWEK